MFHTEKLAWSFHVVTRCSAKLTSRKMHFRFLVYCFSKNYNNRTILSISVAAFLACVFTTGVTFTVQCNSLKIIMRYTSSHFSVELLSNFTPYTPPMVAYDLSTFLFSVHILLWPLSLLVTWRSLAVTTVSVSDVRLSCCDHCLC